MADIKQSEKPFIVTNTQARAIHTCGVLLRPGTPTEIPAEHVEALKKAPAYKARWIVEGVVKMPPPVVVPIGKLDPERAYKLIAVESDLATLRAWIDSEKRPEVLAAIQKRVAAL